MRTIDMAAITFLFKGENFWEYDSHLNLTNSGLIKDRFIGVSGPIDAAFVWSGNGRIYIFKGQNNDRLGREVGGRYDRKEGERARRMEKFRKLDLYSCFSLRLTFFKTKFVFFTRIRVSANDRNKSVI